MTQRKVSLSTRALDALLDDIRSDLWPAADNHRPAHPDLDKLLEYATHGTPSLVSEQVQQHVTICPDCSSRIDAFKAAAQVWEGSDGNARIDRIGKRLHPAGQHELVFPVEDKPGLIPNGNSVREHVSQRRAERSIHDSIIRQILRGAEAIETLCDYVLPNGLHSDTHINLGCICRSEGTLAPVVRVLDEVLTGRNFDTLVSTSWALATIARRLVLRRSALQSRGIRHITVEGYDPPSILEAVPSGANVILLVDVVVTGSQIASVTKELKRQNAASVKAVAIVDTDYRGERVSGPFEALCHVPINIAAPDQCSQWSDRPRAEFNPVAGRMTQKKLKPRSPSEFLEQDSAVRQFWKFVDTAGAFEHHRIVGSRHYLGFIDTARLLRHRVIGPTIVESLCRKIFERSGIPDTVLVPKRTKSLLLGKCLVEGFERHLGKRGVRLVTVRQKSGHFTIQGAPDLSGQRVLVADTAAGHGDTLDELALLSTSGAASIAGAVLLSRLSEACEEAFDQRLTAGFTKLYSMPVRPLTVRDKSRITCSVCLRRQDLKKAIGELPPGAVKDVAKKLAAAAPRYRRRTESSPGIERQAPQLSLYARSPLATYRPSVASGIALHALHAAMGDGMAPLSLPEIASHDISAQRRAALVADLPAGVLKWSGPSLERELCEFLKKGIDRNVWLAVVDLMSRSGSTTWIDSLEDAIVNAQARGNWMDERFWARMILIVHRMVRNTPEVSEHLRGPLENLAGACYKELPARRGLRAMIDTTYQRSSSITNCTT
jgi:orotate phosphoribosyltransferase